MEIERFLIFGAIVLFVILAGVGFKLAIYDIPKSQENLFCARLTLGVLIGIEEDIQRLKEHKQLCTNDNCTIYFDNKLNEKRKLIKDVTSSDFCISSFNG